ncbi:HNH endonuclease [Rhodovulum marinum]|uniref:HNH endonuclease n=1 Tax=Rhodovulum marinum TaxID=320662 RepID=A0A4R2Q7H2_9RHOB|nr:HNH endonuclease [Rhodovulum marinum]TCP43964.1 HNH endonuclease [Rhodovulum marinum]
MIPPEHPAADRRAALLDRVRARVEIDPQTGCWIWQGPTSGTGPREGYPRMSLDGRTVSVHRVMAAHAFGYLHPGRKVDHTCRTRLCVNPAHLEPVTHLENCRRRDRARAIEAGAAAGEL